MKLFQEVGHPSRKQAGQLFGSLTTDHSNVHGMVTQTGVVLLGGAIQQEALPPCTLVLSEINEAMSTTKTD